MGRGAVGSRRRVDTAARGQTGGGSARAVEQQTAGSARAHPHNHLELFDSPRAIAIETVESSRYFGEAADANGAAPHQQKGYGAVDQLSV